MTRAGKDGAVRFAGYAALFNRIDRGGDVIRRGAFKRAVNGAPVPVLLEHRPGSPIGRVEMLAEDRRGLRVIGRVERGAVRDGMGLSFGYRVRTSRSGGDGAAPRRELIEVELVEVSLVAVPMQPGARVHRVVPG